jgi:hypothetical protein
MNRLATVRTRYRVRYLGVVVLKVCREPRTLTKRKTMATSRAFGTPAWGERAGENEDSECCEDRTLVPEGQGHDEPRSSAPAENSQVGQPLLTKRRRHERCLTFELTGSRRRVRLSEGLGPTRGDSAKNCWIQTP